MRVSVEIDRIVWTDPDVKPEQAERIRGFIKVELRRLLEQEPFIAGVVGGKVPHLVAPTIHLDEATGDHHLASCLAQRIVQSLHSVTSQKQKE